MGSPLEEWVMPPLLLLPLRGSGASSPSPLLSDRPMLRSLLAEPREPRDGKPMIPLPTCIVTRMSASTTGLKGARKACVPCACQQTQQIWGDQEAGTCGILSPLLMLLADPREPSDGKTMIPMPACIATCMSDWRMTDFWWSGRQVDVDYCHCG